jgi:transaldolase
MTGRQINRLAELVSLGQSLWLDNIRRSALENGETRLLIERGDIRGMTANPTIFKQAITAGGDYDEAIRALAWSGWDAERSSGSSQLKMSVPPWIFAPSMSRVGGDGFVSMRSARTCRRHRRHCGSSRTALEAHRLQSHGQDTGNSAGIPPSAGPLPRASTSILP